MDLVGKKQFTDANLRKNKKKQTNKQKEQYTQVCLCVHVQNFTPRERCIQV